MAGLGDLLNELGDDLAGILEEIAPDLCNVERATLSDDGRGGQQETWASINLSGPLPCIAYPRSGYTHVTGDAPIAQTSFAVIVKGGQDVLGKDRVRVLARGDEAERLVEVSHVLPHMGVLLEISGTVKI